MANSAGIHHITGITGDGKKNFGFYTKTLGLRFVKRTVNFDDPSAWHLYYGNETGAPGSALTAYLEALRNRCSRHNDMPRPNSA